MELYQDVGEFLHGDRVLAKIVPARCQSQARGGRRLVTYMAGGEVALLPELRLKICLLAT